MTGTISQLSVRVSRKIGDGDFGSFGGEWEATVNLPPDANLEEESQALFAFGKSFLGTELADIQASIKKSQPKALPPLDPGAHERPIDFPPDEPLRPKKDTEEGEELDFVCVKFGLEKTPDKKYKLQLYPKIGDGAGKFPTIKYTAERERMWAMISEVADDYDFTDLPVEHPCEWLVHYKIGKAGTTADGKKFNYKDLLSIVAM